MTTNKDIGFFKRQLLKIITVFQESALVNRNDSVYNWLLELHFKLYYGGTIYGYLVHASTVVNNLLVSPEIEVMLDRHAKMVLNNCFHSKDKAQNKYLYNIIKITFIKDYLADKGCSISYNQILQKTPVFVDVFK